MNDSRPPPPPPVARPPPPPAARAVSRFVVVPPVPVVRPGHDRLRDDAAAEEPTGTDAERACSSTGRGLGFRNAEVHARSQHLSWLGKHLHAELVAFRVAVGPDHVITFDVEQRRAEERSLGTGMMVWDLAVVLVDVLQVMYNQSVVSFHSADDAATLPSTTTNAGVLPGRARCFDELRVLELGAGTAAPGLAAAAFGAHVVLTDLAEVVPLMSSNAQRLRDVAPHAHVDVVPLPWGGEQTDAFLLGRSSHATAASCVPFDLVLVCECIVPRIFPLQPLVDTLAVLLRPCSSHPGSGSSVMHRPLAIVAYEHRFYSGFDPREEFARLLAAQGMWLQPLRAAWWDPVRRARPMPDDMFLWEIEACIR